MICHHKLISSPVAPIVYKTLEEDESKPQGVAFLHPPLIQLHLAKSKTDEVRELSHRSWEAEFSYHRLQNNRQKNELCKKREIPPVLGAGVWLRHINVCKTFESVPQSLCGYSDLSAISESVTDSDAQVYWGLHRVKNTSTICTCVKEYANIISQKNDCE